MLFKMNRKAAVTRVVWCHQLLVQSRLGRIPATLQTRTYSDVRLKDMKQLKIQNSFYETDSVTNVTPKILSKIGANLHNRKYHPLNLIRLRIQNFFYKNFQNRSGNPLFAVFDNLNPVTSVEQNFDSLLIPEDHEVRSRSATYYVNSQTLLRAHTSAHQADLVRSGLNAFLVIGDSYRRDTVDSSHYPVFHQMEGVRLFSQHQLFRDVTNGEHLSLFENGQQTPDKQECHTLEAAKVVEHDLKRSLLGLTHDLFGKDVEYRWLDTFYPFTHPSFELEIKYQDKWLEVLGCGIMKQKLLDTAGANSSIGWAFGLGLERLAMKLYNIPDIRLFWSEDSGFLSQFEVDDPSTPITYKPISIYPQCANDISFWITEHFVENDFYDLVRTVGGDIVEQVTLVDEFFHPKKKRQSHCYKIVYRHMEKTLTQEEVNVVHREIEDAATKELGVEIRRK